MFKQLYCSHLKLDKYKEFLAFVDLKVYFGGNREAPIPPDRIDLPNCINCCESDFAAALWALYYHSNFFTSPAACADCSILAETVPGSLRHLKVPQQ